MPSDIWISIVSSNLLRFIDLSRLIALGKGAAPSLAIRCLKFLIWLRNFLPRAGGTPAFFFFCLSPSADETGAAFGALGASPAGAVGGADSPGGGAGEPLAALSPLSALGARGLRSAL